MTEIMGRLEISPGLLARRHLVCHAEAMELVQAEIAPNGRIHLLIPGAAEAWRRMKAAAREVEIDIHILSAFHSVARQAEVIALRLERGLSLEDVLQVLAPPGYSEHHTGRAVDISTEGVNVLQAEFETTAAFAWLCENADSFGFTLSYPYGNAAGYRYEPWHWCFPAVQAISQPQT